MKVICVFPTLSHAKYAALVSTYFKFANLNRLVEYTLTFSTVPFPLDTFLNIRVLAEATLKSFSRETVSTSRLSIGAIVRPVEAAYQDEFYRSIHHALGYRRR